MISDYNVRVTSQSPKPTMHMYTTRSDYQHALVQAIEVYLLRDLPIKTVADCHRVDVGDMHLVIEGHLNPWQIPDLEDWCTTTCVPITPDIQSAMLRFVRHYEDGTDRLMTGLRVTGAVVGAWLGRRCGGNLLIDQYRKLYRLVEIMGYKSVALGPEFIRAVPLYPSVDVVRCIPRITDATPIGWIGVACPMPDLVAIQYSTDVRFSSIPSGAVVICSPAETKRIVAHCVGSDHLAIGIRSDGAIMIDGLSSHEPIDWTMGIHEVRDINPDHHHDYGDIPF